MQFRGFYTDHLVSAEERSHLTYWHFLCLPSLPMQRMTEHVEFMLDTADRSSIRDHGNRGRGITALRSHPFGLHSKLVSRIYCLSLSPLNPVSSNDRRYHEETGTVPQFAGSTFGGMSSNRNRLRGMQSPSHSGVVQRYK
jgi:hypothetical protein